MFKYFKALKQDKQDQVKFDELNQHILEGNYDKVAETSVDILQPFISERQVGIAMFKYFALVKMKNKNESKKYLDYFLFENGLSPVKGENRRYLELFVAFAFKKMFDTDDARIVEIASRNIILKHVSKPVRNYFHIDFE